MTVQRIALGTGLPTISDMQHQLMDDGSTVFRFAIEYAGGDMSADAEADIVLNWPVRDFASLPVSLTLSLVSFVGQVRTAAPPPEPLPLRPDTRGGRPLTSPPPAHNFGWCDPWRGDAAAGRCTHTDGSTPDECRQVRLSCSAIDSPMPWTLSLLGEPQMELAIHTEIGYAYPLRDVPKVAQLVETTLWDALIASCVWPAFIPIAPLAGLAPDPIAESMGAAAALGCSVRGEAAGLATAPSAHDSALRHRRVVADGPLHESHAV